MTPFRGLTVNELMKQNKYANWHETEWLYPDYPPIPIYAVFLVLNVHRELFVQNEKKLQIDGWFLLSS